jgi:predicted outer membrane repeat protein
MRSRKCYHMHSRTQGAAILHDCVLSDNTAVQSGGSLLVAAVVVQPAAVRVGGALAKQRVATATTLSSCILSGNTAASGGAIACAVDADVTMTQCLVHTNTAVTDVSSNSSY